MTHSREEKTLSLGDRGGNIQRAGSGVQGAGIRRSDRLVKEHGKEEDVVQGLENKLGG